MWLPVCRVGSHHEDVPRPAAQMRALDVALKLEWLLPIALNGVMTAVTVPKVCAERNALSILDKEGGPGSLAQHGQ